MIVWLEKSLVLAVHDRQLAEFGGSAGVRDETLLESALARPQQLFAYGNPPPDLAELAASLAFGIARNHPFVDGNKRTAATSCETFLELNHATLEAEDLELFPQYLALAEGNLSEKDFAAFLRSHIRMSTKNKLHEKKGTYKTKSPVRKAIGKRKRVAR
ncbi:MAG: type II toxin-antitoxin system death-on-curing family toxin [Gammaproteobacteria bacterium]